MVQLELNQARNAKNDKDIYMYFGMKRKIKGEVPVLVIKTEVMATNMKKT